MGTWVCDAFKTLLLWALQLISLGKLRAVRPSNTRDTHRRWKRCPAPFGACVNQLGCSDRARRGMRLCIWFEICSDSFGVCFTFSTCGERIWQENALIVYYKWYKYITYSSGSHIEHDINDLILRDNETCMPCFPNLWIFPFPALLPAVSILPISSSRRMKYHNIY